MPKLDESPGNHDNWKIFSKGHIQYDSIYITFLKLEILKI